MRRASAEPRDVRADQSMSAAGRSGRATRLRQRPAKCERARSSSRWQSCPRALPSKRPQARISPTAVAPKETVLHVRGGRAAGVRAVAVHTATWRATASALNKPPTEVSDLVQRDWTERPRTERLL